MWYFDFILLILVILKFKNCLVVEIMSTKLAVCKTGYLTVY